MLLSQVALRTHPRRSGVLPQLAVLAVAAVLGALLGLLLLAADRSSWAGSGTTTATVTGVSKAGVLATANGRRVTLHLAPVPRAGTTLQVQVSPDGRARPVSFAQSPGTALRDGVSLAVLLAVLLQGYRWAVTRRPEDPAEPSRRGAAPA